jgi:uncharacterized protein
MAEDEGSTLSQDEKTWGMLCHLAGLPVLICVPFGTIIGPLVVWLIKKDQMPFVMDQGKEAVNFQITVAIVGVLLFMLWGAGFVAAHIIGPVALLLHLMLWAFGSLLMLAVVILVILAAVEASKGKKYRYPFALRLIK